MSKKKKKPTKKEQRKRIARVVVICAAVLFIGFGVTAMLWGTKEQHAAVISILPEPEENAGESGRGKTAGKEQSVERQQPEEQTSAVDDGQQELSALKQEIEIGEGNILIIIDDVGYNLHQIQPFLKIEGPIVFAILPGVPYSRQAAEMVHSAGKTCIIHQPMQAVTVQNLGENPILAEMDKEDIRKVLKKSMAEVPYAEGMNNHMGSLITSDPEKMETIMQFLKDRDMLFIDSLTTSESAVKKTAEQLQLPYLHRHVFLDNEKTVEYYTAAFESGIQKAGEKGMAVLIGHVWADGLAETLQELYRKAEQEGVNFITLNELEETVIRYAGIGN